MNMAQKIEENLSLKDKSVLFLNLAAAGNATEAFGRFAGPDFCHHNPYFRGDAESIMNAMNENAAQNPEKIFEVKQTIEEGEMVAVHSHVRQNPDDLGVVVVHIFRFVEGKIVEMWDIGQPIPAESPNENGML